MRKTIAGQSVLDEIARHRAATVTPSTKRPGCWESETLCAHQREMAARGYLGAQIVSSMYGYSVRYDSGLQNWGIIAGSRSGQLDGSLEAAIAYAERWAAQDPTRRYVTMTGEG